MSLGDTIHPVLAAAIGACVGFVAGVVAVVAFTMWMRGGM